MSEHIGAIFCEEKVISAKNHSTRKFTFQLSGPRGFPGAGQAAQQVEAFAEAAPAGRRPGRGLQAQGPEGADQAPLHGRGAASGSAGTEPAR